MSSPPLQLRRSATAHKRPTPVDIVEGEVAVNYHPVSCGFFIKNADGTIVKIGPVEVSTSAPNSAAAGGSGNSEGELWFDPATQELKIYHNSTWITLNAQPVGFTGSPKIGNTTLVIQNGIITDVV